MRNTILIIVGVIIVAVLIWGFSTHWGKKSLYGSNSSSSTTTPTSSSSQPISGQANISIENFSFNPSGVTITKGTKVVWTNNDSTNHTVTSDSGVFNSSPISNGQTFDFTFNDAGTFSYHCSIHATMTAKINVQ